VGRLSGEEPVSGTNAVARDFWSWAMSDLRANTVRSLLAEFLVAEALGATSSPRVEWDSCDVRLTDGSRIEVKASAYLQAWDQRSLSKPVFGGFKARTWSARTGTADLRTYNADVYVFALQAATSHDKYDALDAAAWLFWTLPRGVIEGTGYSALSLNTLRRLAGEPVTYDALHDAIHAALRVDRAGPITAGKDESDDMSTPGWCDLHDMDRAYCPHAAADRLTRRMRASFIRVSPRGIAHFDGCPHKGDQDTDYSRWGTVGSDSWQAIGNGRPVQATGGRTDLQARHRCSDCVAHGPW
jgi:hypothetical protein